MKRYFDTIHWYDCLILILSILFCGQLLFNSKIISSSIQQALLFCAKTVIPSLFCFMVLTAFLSASKLKHLLSLVMLPICRLCCLSWSSGNILFLSLIGGYPAGTKALSDAYKQKDINAATLKRMVLFAVCPAPSFVIVTIGCQFYKSFQVGVLLYIAQLLSALLLAFLTSIPVPVLSKSKISHSLTFSGETSYGDALVHSVTFASQTLLNMCGYIVFFTVVIELLKQFELNERWIALLSATMEISCGVVELTKVDYPYYLQLLTFFLSFGGLSVQFQLKSILKDCPCSLFRIIIGRTLHGICSAAIVTVLLTVFPQAAAVFSADSAVLPQSNRSSIMLSFCLIGMMFILLTSVKYKRQNSR